MVRHQVLTTVVLSVGVAAVLLIGTAFDTAFLAPLHEATERAIQIDEQNAAAGVAPGPVSTTSLQYWRSRARWIADVSAFYQAPSAVIHHEGRDALVNVAGVSPALFRVFGAKTAPLLPPDGEIPGGVLLIGRRLFETFFDGNPLVIGGDILINGRSRRVLAIVEDGLPLLTDVEIFRIDHFDEEVGARHRSVRYLTALGRVREGDFELARAEIRAFAVSLGQEFPDSHRGWEPLVRDVREVMYGDSRQALPGAALAAAAVVLLTLSSCLGLVLLSHVERRRILRLKLALGASPSTLTLELLRELAKVALAAFVLGLAITALSQRLLWAAGVEPFDRFARWWPTPLSLGIGLGFAVASALVIASMSAVPLLPIGVTRRGYLGAIGLAALGRSRFPLLLLQAAGATAVMAVGVSLTTSLAAKLFFDRGFAIAGTSTAFLRVDSRRMDETVEILRRSMKAFTQGRPNLRVALASLLPFDPDQATFVVRGPDMEPVSVSWVAIAGDYFNLLEMLPTEGRIIESEETWTGSTGVVLSETAAARLFPGGQAVGQFITRDIDQRRWRIVGIIASPVGKARTGLDAPLPRVFASFGAEAFPFVHVLIRGRGASAFTEKSLAEQLRVLDPRMAVVDFKSMQEYLLDATRPSVSRWCLMTLFALAALTISLAGAYGAASIEVASRQWENAVREALGASRASLQHRLIARIGAPVVVGVSLGCALGWSAIKSLETVGAADSLPDSLWIPGLAAISLLLGTTAALVEPAQRIGRTSLARTLQQTSS